MSDFARYRGITKSIEQNKNNPKWNEANKDITGGEFWVEKTISDSKPAADSVWPNVDESIFDNDYNDYTNSELDGSIFDPNDPRNKNIPSFEESVKAGEYLREKYGDDWSKKSKKSKKQGGILRYPMEALTHHTDYLQIDIVEYKPVGNDVKTKAHATEGKWVDIPKAEQKVAKDSNYNLVSKKTWVAKRIVETDAKFVGSHGNRKGNNLNSRAGGMRSYGLANRPLINTGTIILPIPANIQDTNSVDYSDSKLDGLQGAAATAVYKTMSETDITKNNIADVASNAASTFQGTLAEGGVTPNKAKDLALTKLTSHALSIFGGNVTANQLYARSRGEVINPNMELLFNGPKLRAFKFSFKLTPRNEREAKQCKLIIRAFKRNMAPKSNPGGKGFFLKTPNIFELRYRSGLKNHPFLHKFKQCFLTDVNVNYTGDGVYSTYDDATPVSMILDLSFKELEPIFDIDYDAEQGLEGVGY